MTIGLKALRAGVAQGAGDLKPVHQAGVTGELTCTMLYAGTNMHALELLIFPSSYAFAWKLFLWFLNRQKSIWVKMKWSHARWI